jgi:hypothetical protein
VVESELRCPVELPSPAQAHGMIPSPFISSSFWPATLMRPYNYSKAA